jgi:16S rRNA (uracil1498-N3)-methyltransferase
LLNVLSTLTNRRAAIVIGPEGGFDDHERQSLRGMENVYPVNLGPRILRADTAAISALTLYQAALGDWK